MVELLKQSGLTTTDLSVQKTLSCRVLFVLVPVVVSGAGTDGGVCCNGLRCAAVALTQHCSLPWHPAFVHQCLLLQHCAHAFGCAPAGFISRV